MVFHEKIKQVAKDCHFIHDEIVRGVIEPLHVSTKLQLADILTKALGRKKFQSFLIKLGICDLHTPT
ncbi:Retrovirus-related Pol polyprotein from transposon RE1 [Cardamine amara subsp. amara]|uniref:Retrovirus-related Pol polyprotein from transposon RE1 n=1 Tax=Cardamine amara subsp. amara TaxID=228776 RepID=A0ABD1C5D4_CARAN